LTTLDQLLYEKQKKLKEIAEIDAEIIRYREEYKQFYVKLQGNKIKRNNKR